LRKGKISSFADAGWVVLRRHYDHGWWADSLGFPFSRRGGCSSSRACNWGTLKRHNLRTVMEVENRTAHLECGKGDLSIAKPTETEKGHDAGRRDILKKNAKNHQRRRADRGQKNDQRQDVTW